MMTRIPPGALTSEEKFLLEWLSKEEVSAYGECEGTALLTLVNTGLAKVTAHERGGYAEVSLTEAGVAFLSHIQGGGMPALTPADTPSGPEMEPVTSTQVAAIGYDAEREELHVKWHSGKTSIYCGVPADLRQALLKSPSIGRALRTQVRDKFAHRYLED